MHRTSLFRMHSTDTCAQSFRDSFAVQAALLTSL